jgi:sodium-dependent dicarboxylate transporter 2/3/5
MNRLIKSLIAFGIPLLILFIPIGWIPIEALTVPGHRVIALFVMAALCWVLEPIPIFATSVLVITLELILISDKGLILFTQGLESDLLSHREIMATFASPIIMLFLGGFFLAIAATKYRLDQNLARVLLKPFGTDPKAVMFGLMVITAVFSMFMSNTATTAMMLSILAPVLMVFNENDKGKTAFALSIPVAANVGGIATPIGTPPNAIALKYLTGPDAVSFSQWIAFGLPFVILLLLLGWVLLVYLFPISTPRITLDMKGKFLKTPQAITVYVTFVLTLLLWLTDFLHGMNAYVVALVPVAIFTATGILGKEDLKKVSWEVLWLVSGGIALGVGLEKTGLASGLVASIPFDGLSVMVLTMAFSILTLLMANFMSHTATANLLLPIVAALCTSLDGIEAFGGAKAMILTVTFAASLGMSLPISTPPNALAHATGYVRTNDMAVIGTILGILGLVLTILLFFLLGKFGWL